MAVGGAAYLVSKAIRAAKVVAFEDLGMEAIYEFEVEDMPVTVAVDARASRCMRRGRGSGRLGFRRSLPGCRFSRRRVGGAKPGTRGDAERL